eukprot:2688968-Rhodomonas_salina.1
MVGEAGRRSGVAMGRMMDPEGRPGGLRRDCFPAGATLGRQSVYLGFWRKKIWRSGRLARP